MPEMSKLTKSQSDYLCHNAAYFGLPWEDEHWLKCSASRVDMSEYNIRTLMAAAHDYMRCDNPNPAKRKDSELVRIRKIIESIIIDHS